MRRDEGRSRDDSRGITGDDAIGPRRPFASHRLSPLCPSLVGTEKMASSRVPEIRYVVLNIMMLASSHHLLFLPCRGGTGGTPVVDDHRSMMHRYAVMIYW